MDGGGWVGVCVDGGRVCMEDGRVCVEGRRVCGEVGGRVEGGRVGGCVHMEGGRYVRHTK